MTNNDLDLLLKRISVIEQDVVNLSMSLSIIRNMLNEIKESMGIKVEEESSKKQKEEISLMVRLSQRESALIFTEDGSLLYKDPDGVMRQTYCQNKELLQKYERKNDE